VSAKEKFDKRLILKLSKTKCCHRKRGLKEYTKHSVSDIGMFTALAAFLAAVLRLNSQIYSALVWP
jgi:hypothetical protein